MFFHPQPTPTALYYHQRVSMNCWCIFSFQTDPCCPLLPPTSLYDLLVCFSIPNQPLLVSTTANESLWLVGVFFPPNRPPAALYYHQRVSMTRWLVYFILPQPHRFQQPPTSLCDSLVGFLCPPLSSPASTTTNESSWLVGWFSLLPPKSLGMLVVPSFVVLCLK